MRMGVHLFEATSSQCGASYALPRKAEHARYKLAEVVVQRVLLNFYSVSSESPWCLGKTARK